MGGTIARVPHRKNYFLGPSSVALDIQTKLDDWRSKLLDLTKRNRLVNCKIGARGAIQILHPDGHKELGVSSTTVMRPHLPLEE